MSISEDPGKVSSSSQTFASNHIPMVASDIARKMRTTSIPRALCTAAVPRVVIAQPITQKDSHFEAGKRCRNHAA